MANERLKSAMKAANITVKMLAEKTDVDPKTAQYWLQGRVPHFRHRMKVAGLLNMREDILWPMNSDKRTAIPTQCDEIIAAYVHRADIPPTEWWQLFLSAETSH